jgi:peptidoglycan/xylan/chitin deacetylase (PgdA/CDA1 family)
MRQKLKAGIRRLLRRVRGADQRKILMYHRIGSETVDPWDLVVSPAHFEEHVAYLARTGPCATLSAALAASPAQRQRLSVVTFDDGYLDNLMVALPILERHGVPMTLFVVSGAVGSASWFWWDAVEAALLGKTELPASLRLSLDGAIREWQLDEAAVLSPAEARRLATWRADQDPPDTPRAVLFLSVYETLFELSPEARDLAVEELLSWAGLPPSAPGDRRCVTRTELMELANHPLVEIGAHTVSHPALSLLNAERQEAEIAGGKQALEQMLDRPVRTLSFPHGRYDETSVRLASEAGYSCACTSGPGPAFAAFRKMALPRLQVCDWPADRFRQELALTFGT